MKTAVEWLESEIERLTTKAGIHLSWAMMDDLLNQAKEMEKEQMNKLFTAGVIYGSGSVMANEWGEDTTELNFEQYYNETYKK